MLLLFLSILLLSSTHFQNGVQPVTAQSSTSTSNFRMIGLQLELKQNGTNYFTAVNNSRDAKITNVQNNTIARFVASFSNENPTDAYMIQAFSVNIFNSTVNTVAENSLTFAYKTTSPGNVVVPANGSFTAIFQAGLPFRVVKGELYTIQYQFTYSISTNATDTQVLNSPFNFTLSTELPPYSPPTFIIYAWWAINGIILVHFLIGWYGNRKVRKQTQINNNNNK